MIGLVVPTDPALPVSKIDVDGLDDYQAVVGGYIEAVRPRQEGRRAIMNLTGIIGYANEEGLLRGLPANPRASSLFGQPLVGNVLILEDAVGLYDPGDGDECAVSENTILWATGDESNCGRAAIDPTAHAGFRVTPPDEQ